MQGRLALRQRCEFWPQAFRAEVRVLASICHPERQRRIWASSNPEGMHVAQILRCAQNDRQYGLQVALAFRAEVVMLNAETFRALPAKQNVHFT